MEDSKPGSGSGARRSRSVLVSFLGAIVRRMGNWMPIAGVVELMGQFGLDESSVRTAVFRLKQRGWLVPETRGGMKGYLLTAEALDSLASGDEIVWHARQPANLDDGWCIVNFSVPESARARRHQLRARLTTLGFGIVGSAVWIAPARMLEAAKRVIDELDLTTQCAIFVGHYSGGPELDGLLRSSWDLDEIDQRYREFIELHGDQIDQLESSGVIDGEVAFVAYLTAIDHWRQLPFRDPGLPRELLGDDWAAPAAGALFERLVALLEGRALAHAAGYWPTTPHTP
ncbi:PaaX family transcriptional regulator C-terminal domain-containing protein [Streptomyces fulvoviolaceus]|uniref:PaaX family transcriptional regulator n=1 Tax=Streptomyces fulvoviolaceus TaxID=285535 RepID=UPI0006938AC1|nr:PaaX family transcriptional regulator C-terminal domain-containing protein [Streptomyces fulvoviolaceus]